MYTGITMDGTAYRVRVRHNTLVRSFALLEGPNAGDMLTGRHERDLLGTGYSYQLAVEPAPEAPEDYDRFYEALSAPVDTHTITLPYGQGTMTFEAEILGGSDTWGGRLAGYDRWSGLVVEYRYIQPQRVPV